MRLLPASSLLCVVDLQEKLLAAMPDADRVVAMATRLATAAGILGVRALLTEQYPRGLGHTPAALATHLPPAIEKMSFSCCGAASFRAALAADARGVVLCGLETHVCITQTALDLLADGLAVFVVVDAVAARHRLDHEIGLRRLEAAGAVVMTSEAVLFEWCRSADHPQFQAIRRLVVSA